MFSLKQKLASRVEKKPDKVLPKRAGIVKMFVDKLNETRHGQEITTKDGKKKKLNPVDGKRMAIKLSKKNTGMSDGDLYAFYKECEYQKNFTAKFWSSFKQLQ